ncbi:MULTISPECIES: 4'-phosphopantetheinyl transferase family protein [Vibrio]|nr:4'-phosphopantetheinyl transferase superfamily protein [Vibrio kanaloae]OEF16210.1 4-phosphopantetheinyl transferase [Vibrio kanaloae 5S-149]
MFVPLFLSKPSFLPFIKDIEVGYVRSNPALHYCSIVFDSDGYQDSLFDYFNVPFPTSLGSSVQKRRAEYIAARYAAQILLKKLGCGLNVGSSWNREPIWPFGFSGSLSHTSGKAIAVVSQQPNHWSPGIDIEVFEPTVIQESENVFTTNTERNLLKASSMQYELALLVTFSVKESLYKSLYPTVRRYFGFDAAKICSIDNRVGRVSLELTQDLTSVFTKGTKFSGLYSYQDNLMTTLVM